MSLQVILPAHNESGNVFAIHEGVCKVLEPTGYSFTMLFVDDGSTDGTLERLRELSLQDPRVRYIELSRNFGHQSALKAGLDHCDADVLIMMDCDLQHPPALIGEMLRLYEEGYDVVRTRRRQASHTGWLKRRTSKAFYDVMSSLSDIEMEDGSADFRLISGSALAQLRSFGEYDLFYRGLVKWMGFRQVSIEYDPAPRHAGESKYSYRKMIGFGIKGLTSFSTRPLYMAAYMGMGFSIGSLAYVPYVIYSFYHGRTVHGWTSVIMAVIFFGGLNMLILGIIGVYISKIFYQTKQRPHYIVKSSNL